MWSIILYFLFGIGQSANTQTTADSFSIQTASMDNTEDGDGGDKGNPPPRK